MEQPLYLQIVEDVKKHPNTFTYKSLGLKYKKSPNSVSGIIGRAGLRDLIIKETTGLTASEEVPMARKTNKDLTVEARLESQVREKDLAKKETDRKYKLLQEEIRKAEKARDDALLIMSHKPKVHKIPVPKNKKNGAGTVVLLASDWHAEEHVPRHKVNDLNEYNLTIAERRAKKFFELANRFLRVDAQETEIKNIILWLGGDFITGSEMHDAECLLHPAPATMFVQELLISGILYLREMNPDIHIHVVGSVGNHSRMSGSAKKVNQATEQERSLEWMMYHSIKAFFASDQAVTFTLSNSYHSYVDVHGYRIRFNHGHLGWRYNNGLGGIHGPAWKCITQVWDTQIKADLTCFGHYHTYTPAAPGRAYMANGSLIGVSPYSMQFGNEPPIQAYFVMHSKYGVVNQRPLYVDDR